MRVFVGNRFFNRMRQYGYRFAFYQIASAMFRWIYQLGHIVFVIPDFHGWVFYDPSIISLTPERIQQAGDAKEVSMDVKRLLSGFTTEWCSGVYAEVHGSLNGYGFAQFEGRYCFGCVEEMIIPPTHVVLKNLFVFPGYRGRKLGQRLIEPLFAFIPSECLSVGLIIPENRVAVRNWERHSFRRII